MQHIADAQRKDLPPEPVDKWEILRVLAVARRRYDLSDRDLSVLQALLSFQPGDDLDPRSGPLVVHPSNRSICARLNGMACSTMRRHLAKLVASGVLMRRDSPNGKRYTRRQAGEKIAYGFDLSPLLRRFAEFRDAAAETEAAEAALTRLREAVSLMRRDLAALTQFGEMQCPNLALWDRLSDLAAFTARDLRRKLEVDALQQMERNLQAALDQAAAALTPDDQPQDISFASESSTSEARNEHQIQSSETDSFERRSAPQRNPTLQTPPPDKSEAPHQSEKTQRLPNIPLHLVLQFCREIQTFVSHPLRTWHDLIGAAQIVSPMMGISRSALEAAHAVMGPQGTAVTVAAMLERVSEIRSPGGYLRCLTDKASRGRFSCGPMLAALQFRTSGQL